MVTNTSGITMITVKDETIKIKFGLPACQAFSELYLAAESDKYVSGTKLLAPGMAKLLLAAYENQCLIDDKTPVHTFGDFFEFVEDTLTDDPKEVERIMKVFSDSRYLNNLLRNVDESTEESKKKLSIGSLSSHSHSTNSGSLKNSTTNVRSGSLSSGKRGTNVSPPKKQRRKKQ